MIIVVPYRDRQLHLNEFIPHMRKRFSEAEIVVVEQSGGQPFNRGKLLNIGFLESTGLYYCFHDVDMLPIKADYSYPESPTHLATKVEQFGFKMPFAEYFGGVTMFNLADFKKVNGYTNNMWGWGAEDNDMYDYTVKAGLQIASRECTYRSLPHPRKINPTLHQANCDRWKQGRPAEDGLSHCIYNVIDRKNLDGYTKITVEI